MGEEVENKMDEEGVILENLLYRHEGNSDQDIAAIVITSNSNSNRAVDDDDEETELRHDRQNDLLTLREKLELHNVLADRMNRALLTENAARLHNAFTDKLVENAPIGQKMSEIQDMVRMAVEENAANVQLLKDLADIETMARLQDAHMDVKDEIDSQAKVVVTAHGEGSDGTKRMVVKAKGKKGKDAAVEVVDAIIDKKKSKKKEEEEVQTNSRNDYAPIQRQARKDPNKMSAVEKLEKLGLLKFKTDVLRKVLRDADKFRSTGPTVDKPVAAAHRINSYSVHSGGVGESAEKTVGVYSTVGPEYTVGGGVRDVESATDVYSTIKQSGSHSGGELTEETSTDVYLATLSDKGEVYSTVTDGHDAVTDVYSTISLRETLSEDKFELLPERRRLEVLKEASRTVGGGDDDSMEDKKKKLRSLIKLAEARMVAQRQQERHQQREAGEATVVHNKLVKMREDESERLEDVLNWADGQFTV